MNSESFMPNLLNENDVINLYRNRSEIFGVCNEKQLIDALKVFSELGINPQLLEYDDSMHITLIEHGKSRKVPIQSIINLAMKLICLKNCQGFKTLSNGFNNPTQFVDTMFEANCAFFMLNQEMTSELEFAPDVNVQGRNKNPDFSILSKSGSKIFCECKSIASVHRVSNAKANKLIERLYPCVSNIIPDKFRVEISFGGLPDHWNKNLADQLAAAIKVLINVELISKHLELNIENYKISIKLCKHDEEQYFESVIVSADKPWSDKPNLIVSEICNLQKPIKKAIKDALTQLPLDKPSLVFLYSINEFYARQAIEKFLSKNNLNSILCGVVSCTDRWSYYINKMSSFKLFL